MKKSEKTLRDEIAIAAMNGLLSHPDCRETDKIIDIIGDESYKIADAMMKARNK